MARHLQLELLALFPHDVFTSEADIRGSSPTVLGVKRSQRLETANAIGLLPLCQNSSFHTYQTTPSRAGLTPVNHHLHDVHDVSVAVRIEVEVGTIAIVPTLAAPFVGYHHDVVNVHFAIAVEITDEMA